MQGICKLCGQDRELKESHFIPKFVGKWIKKTSVTGFLRESNEMGKRAQDTAKEYWLCGCCEGLFSQWEREFANGVFYPFVNDGASTAKYNNWMSKFCASISWRTLTFIRSKNPTDEKNLDYQRILNNAQEHLKNYLLGVVNNLNQYEQHLFPLKNFEHSDSSNVPPNMNRYFLRSFAMDIVGNNNDQFIYTKLPSFILLGVIKAKNLKSMRSSRIAINSGQISPRIYRLPGGLSDYIFEKADEMIELHKKIPEKHIESFEKYIRENPEKVASSKQFQAFLEDYNRFGNDVFK